MTETTKNNISLQKLLAKLISEEELERLGDQLSKEISGLVIDSRQQQAGQAFLAYPGHNVDGRDFIMAAIEKGATAVIVERKNLSLELSEYLQNLMDKNSRVTFVFIDDLAKKVAEIAAKFYANPTKKMTVVGITGTNGKTSICYLVSQILGFLGNQALMLSTLGNGVIGELAEAKNTTADGLTIQKTASEHLARNIKFLAMEVSSHGLAQQRVEQVDFDIAVFTNLSHDHLEYHGSMEQYFQAKRQLFLNKKVKVAVINADDEYGRRLLLDEEIKCKKVAFSRNEQDLSLAIDDWVIAKDEQYNLSGISASLYTPWGNARLNSSLLGDFNLSNLLAVSAVLGSQFGAIEKWIIGLNAAQPVIGRMQRFQAKDKPTIVVDYAHTPDALDKALATLKNHCQAHLWCVFGCGGDRDTEKRPLMGAIAEQRADQVLLTDDNPRTEDANTIVEMIRQGMKDKSADYISSREQAIAFAMTKAATNDMILVAGKGHEDYQEIAGTRRHYSDLETVQTLMEANHD